MSLSREQMLAEMGIVPLWVPRQPAVAAEDAAPPAAAAAGLAVEPAGVVEKTVANALPEAVAEAAEGAHGDWQELAAAVAACRLCPLCQQRQQAVLGVGDRRPDWLFIGEGPGAEEDARGEPFVGQAGKLLDNMLAALDMARGQRVYIGNAVKCRPPGNRTPEAAEIAACRPWLERQIALLQPKIIVLLGKVAVHSVLHEDRSLASLRGRRLEHGGIPLVVTYHPAYLLRNLPDKAKAWEDLLFARRVLRDSLA
ncbi:MAG: uracil-DNA glycosylase [Betaproteobacteria bacterium]|nr:uracil-DNA glycosylase [Betaproteobacteria bacterium]MCL2886041.1 uracil-DNA glycosylase [Betaproteobacteria bacterium]